MPTTLTDATFRETVAGADVPVIVDFWATWCGPCKTIAPILEELADEYAGRWLIAKLDVDENPMSAREYGVMSIPTIAVFVDGVEKGRIVGAKAKAALVSEIDALLAA